MSLPSIKSDIVISGVDCISKKVGLWLDRTLFQTTMVWTVVKLCENCEKLVRKLCESCVKIVGKLYESFVKVL